MRPIKFRGMCPRSRKWVYGDFIHDQEPYGAPYPTIFPFGNGINVIEDGFEVDPSTVGQFTGLTDKNGKEIFEGDVLKCHDHPTDVESGVFIVSFYEGKYITGMQDLGDWEQEWVEIIGNIHDNPDLI
jgi:uncharacterized phage protein (TIGR01671 family)